MEGDVGRFWFEEEREHLHILVVSIQHTKYDKKWANFENRFEFVENILFCFQSL